MASPAPSVAEPSLLRQDPRGLFSITVSLRQPGMATSTRRSRPRHSFPPLLPGLSERAGLWGFSSPANLPPTEGGEAPATAANALMQRYQGFARPGRGAS